MPPAAFALVALFLACSLVAGVAAVRLLSGSLGGPSRGLAYVLPVGASFAAFYAIGHRLGLSVGPEISLFGFQVALLGDVAIGFAAALAAALVQSLIVRARRPRPRADLHAPSR